MRRTTHIRTGFCVLAFMLGAAGGCSLQPAPSPTIAQFEPMPARMVVSLGAGDTLGRAIYVNDLILAAGEAKRSQNPVVTVPDEGIDAELAP